MSFTEAGVHQLSRKTLESRPCNTGQFSPSSDRSPSLGRLCVPSFRSLGLEPACMCFVDGRRPDISKSNELRFGFGLSAPSEVTCRDVDVRAWSRTY